MRPLATNEYLWHNAVCLYHPSSSPVATLHIQDTRGPVNQILEFMHSREEIQLAP